VRGDEAQTHELVPQGAVVGDLGRGVPLLERHGRVELRLGGAQRDGGAVAAGDLVAEREEEEVLVGELLLAGEDETLGERVEEAAELEPPQDRLEVRGDHLGRHRASPSCRGRGIVYSLGERR